MGQRDRDCSFLTPVPRFVDGDPDSPIHGAGGRAAAKALAAALQLEGCK